MSVYPISALINTLASLFLSAFVLYKKRSRLNVSFALFGFSVAFWSCAYFFWQISGDAVKAVFWSKTLTIGSIFIPVFYLKFVLFLLELDRKRINRILTYGSYVLASSFAFLAPTSLLVDGVSAKLGFKFWPNAGRVYWLFLLMFFGLAIYSIVLLWLAYGRTDGTKREQIKFILIGTGIGYLGGSTNFLLWYDIPILPLGNILASLYVILTAYAIVAHRLMDIKIVARRSTVYLATVLTVVGPAGVIFYYANQLFPQAAISVGLAVLILGVSVFAPVRSFFYRLANKYLFSSLYDSGQVIAALSEKLRSTLEIDSIYNFISDAVANSFHAKAVGILAYSQQNGNYIVQFNNGFDIGRQRKLPSNKKLREMVDEQSQALVVEELKAASYKDYQEAIDLLTQLGVALVAPFNIEDETVGIIVMGAKESGDMYNDEDLKTLKVIASQAAIAIKNAQLYEETKNFSLKLQQEVDRQTAELKKANVELQKLDKAKSDFVSIASHQLRTPLTAIKGFISMALEGSYGQVSDTISGKLNELYEKNERLIKLVDNLLDLSHMEGGKMQFEFKSVDLAALTTSVVEELSPAAQKRGLEFRLNIPPEPCLVRADEEKLRQVLMNLIDNAVKYTEKGGVGVDLKRQEGWFLVAVKDTGAGMTKPEIANLFQKFVRGANAPRLHTEGAGIGLYVAKLLVEAHQGQIWAESEGEGKGSTFLVRLREWKE